MSQLTVGAIWGVSRRIAKRLNATGIMTVLDLRNVPLKENRAQFDVVMGRTCNKLRGISYLELEDVAPHKLQIMSSRSFGSPVESLDALREVVASYLARFTEKLRAQGSVAAGVHVYIQRNRFKESDLQYSQGLVVPLSDATDDTRLLTRAATHRLDLIFKLGYKYKKASIMLTLISDTAKRQETLFDDPVHRAQSAKLIAALDAINSEYGRDTVRTAASGTKKPWAMHSENRSPRFTTRWDQLPVAR